MNINKLMKQAQQMQQKMDEVQAKMGDIEVTGTAGAGMVKITLNARGEARRADIDPKVIDADDKEMLEDLIVAAINNAKEEAEKIAQEEMQKVAGGMGLPPGMKMPF